MKPGIRPVSEWPGNIRRVAFITPPSKRPVLRDYYCTSTTKGNYYWHPADLWVQGAYLKDYVETRLFEGPGQEPARFARAIANWKPDLLVVLVGGFSLDDDTSFARAVAHATGAPLVIGGESVFLGWGHWQRQPMVAGLLTGFAGPGLRSAITGSGLLDGFLPRPDSRGPFNGAVQPAGQATLAWGLPPDWPLEGYRYPLLGRPFASVLTSYGCPFRCNYCNNNRDILGVAVRDLDDLALELGHWAEKGLRWLHFRDVNFGGPLANARRILRHLADRQYGFRWNAFLRPEIVTGPLAEQLAASGCVQIQMGVESASQDTLDRVSRKGKLEQVRRAFEILDRVGIRRGAHFVLGLPGESVDDVQRTIDFACSLNPDYASFNIGIVRGGTIYDGGAPLGDCSGDGKVDSISLLDSGQLRRLQRTANRRFYLRSRFVGRTIRSLARDPGLFPRVIADGVGLLMT